MKISSNTVRLSGVISVLVFSSMMATLTPDHEPAKEIQPLLTAVIEGDQSHVKQMLVAGWDVNKTDCTDSSAMMFASEYGYVNIVEDLLQAGVKINATNRWGQTSLMLAAQWGHAPIVSLLLEHGADPNKLDNKGQSALMLAAQYDYDIIAHQLLVHGANPAQVDHQGNTAFKYAVSWNSYTVMGALMAQNKEKQKEKHALSTLSYVTQLDSNILM